MTLPTVIDAINPFIAQIAKEGDDTKIGGAVVIVVLNTVSWLWKSITSVLIYNMSIKLSEGEKLSFGNIIIKDFMKYVYFYLTLVMMATFTFIGFLLLIVPGIILMYRLFFAPYIVISKNISPIEAMRESWRITSGSVMSLFLMGLVFVGIGIAITISAWIVTLAATITVGMINAMAGVIFGTLVMIFIYAIAYALVFTSYANAYQDIRKD